jgi:hypothetical protein
VPTVITSTPSGANPYLLEFLRGAAGVEGVSVGEHPAFGGVSAGHMAGSEHFKGNAGDLNGPPAKLLALVAVALDYGLNVIYTPWRVHPNARTAANHRKHMHVDGGPQNTFTGPSVNVERARARLSELQAGGSGAGFLTDVTDAAGNLLGGAGDALGLDRIETTVQNVGVRVLFIAAAAGLVVLGLARVVAPKAAQLIQGASPS